jgi:hypothetical protein
LKVRSQTAITTRLGFVAVAPVVLIVAVVKPIRVVAQKKIGSGLSEALAIVDFV